MGAIMPGTILSLLMLAGLALLGGAAYLLVGKRDRKRALLMIAAGVVMLGNVAIWAVPIR
jgi:hypothetical protein